MSLTLIDNPVITEGGVVKNLFAGFLPVNFQFKREDLQILSIGTGIDQYIRITVGVDLTTYLSEGDYLHLYAEGLTGFIYNSSGLITSITATEIDVEINFVESATDGYINYLKNWYLESELVDPSNPLIKILPFSLKNDGDLEGNITLDVSIGNDKNNQFFEFVSQLLDETSIYFKVQYRQVYEGSSESFTLIDTEIILVFATQQPDHESFLNSLDESEFYQGYPFGVVLSHSAENSDGAAIDVVYDELDINKASLTTDNAIKQFNADNQGFLFCNVDKSIIYDSDTEYIRLKGTYAATLAFFSGTFFDNSFFETT